MITEPVVRWAVVGIYGLLPKTFARKEDAVEYRNDQMGVWTNDERSRSRVAKFELREIPTGEIPTGEERE